MLAILIILILPMTICPLVGMILYRKIVRQPPGPKHWLIVSTFYVMVCVQVFFLFQRVVLIRQPAVAFVFWLLVVETLFAGPFIGAYLLDQAIEARRRREPSCRACGYNLTGNVSGVCPECGTPISDSP